MSCWAAASPSSISNAAGAGCKPSSRRMTRGLEPALAALIERVKAGQIKRLALEKVNGEPALGSPLTHLLVALGFQEGPRRMTLSA